MARNGPPRKAALRVAAAGKVSVLVQVPALLGARNRAAAEAVPVDVGPAAEDAENRLEYAARKTPRYFPSPGSDGAILGKTISNPASRIEHPINSSAAM